MDSSIALLLAGSLSILYLICRHYYAPSSLGLPPGPKGSFFWGARNLLSSTAPWKRYADWAREYDSPIISFRVYNRRIVVLNDLDSVRSLLIKRAGTYSDRPRSWMYHDLCGRGNSVFNISATNSKHSQYRKLISQGLAGQAIKEYWPLLEDEADVLVDGLTIKPQEFEQHLRRNSAAVMMKVAFGYTVKEDDPFINLAEETTKISGWALTPGRWLVDYYPIVRFIPSWFPFAGFKRQAEVWKDRLDYLSGVPHEWVKSQMATGKHVESFTSRLLKPDNSSETLTTEEEDIIKWTAGGLYAGATDTTVSAMMSFVLLMALHPDVQKRAQAEIDEYAGCHETAAIPILGNLRYLNAVLKEVLRYAPVSNLALPHKVIEDDVYLSYKIPKDSAVIPNVWAIMHDPDLFPNPFQFNPSRFLGNPTEDSLKSSDAVHWNGLDPRSFAFGFGRRTCPGMQFAETSLLLCMSRILAKFDITLPEGVQAPEVEFTEGITSHIKPFDIIIRRRD